MISRNGKFTNLSYCELNYTSSEIEMDAWLDW